MRILKILILLLLIAGVSRAQSPYGLPSPYNSNGYYRIGWYQSDSGILNALRDTTVRMKYAGMEIMWPHSTVDTNVWFYDGRAYFRYLRTAADVYNVLGGIPAMSLTTNNTSGAATLVNGVLNIPQYSGGGGGSGNILSLNGLTAGTQYLTVGSSGSDFNITQSGGATNIFNLPTASAITRGALSTSDWANFNSKQAALNGTGYVKVSGTTVSYDNNTYYLATNPNSYIALTALSALSPALYSNSTGVISVDTSTGLTHLATQAYAQAHGGGSAVTSVGNLSPLFTTTVISNNLSFSLINASPYNIYGNFTSSTGAPSFGLITVNNMAAISAKQLLGNPTTSSATPSNIPLGFGLIFQSGALALDSAHLHDTTYAVNGLTVYGTTQDSIGLGGRLYQSTHISGANLYNLYLDSTQLFLGVNNSKYTTPNPLDTTNYKLVVRKVSDGSTVTMSWQSGGGSGSPLNLQVFTSSGTWTKPVGCQRVRVKVIGGGGAGGSGDRDATTIARVGGGGGGGGGESEYEFDASGLPSTVTITVGTGGTGGTAITTNTTGGNTGGNGTYSAFGTYVLANGGSGGAGGGPGYGGGGGAGGAGMNQTGSSGGSASTTGGNGVSGGNALAIYPTGGSSGAGISTGNVAGTYGFGGAIGLYTNPQNNFFPGYVAGANGGTMDGTYVGYGANCANANNAAIGIAGGNGGNYGGGGAGGAASTNGYASGAGGNGAAGVVVVTSYY
jgi:hypothetical protein